MTIYLVKEADSGSPSSWPGPARLRPITREGRRQARALVACLQGHPISRILTGPNLRCRETVMPLADARDLVIESDHALGEMADVDRALKVVRAAAARSLLVCTYASLVEAMVGTLLLDGGWSRTAWPSPMDSFGSFRTHLWAMSSPQAGAARSTFWRA